MKTGPGHATRAAAALLWLLVSACGTRKIDPPPPAPPAPLPLEVGPAPPTDFGEIQGHPLAEWIYADSLGELHAIWSERFALDAAPEVNANALWPYADAVLLDGVSWGMAAETSTLTYMDTAGHAYQRAGTEHPKTGDQRPRRSLSPEALEATGWPALQTGTGLQRFDEGPGFRVAGPVRAAASCLACHAFEPDRVVALLLYDFQEIPDD